MPEHKAAEVRRLQEEGLVTAIDLSRATMLNIRQNLVFAFVYNGSPMIAAAAMALSSLSVLANANRLRGFTAPNIVDVASGPGTEAVVRVGREEGPAVAASGQVSDPVCGMSVELTTAAATLEHDGRAYYFCSPHCATNFTADLGKYTKAAIS